MKRACIGVLLAALVLGTVSCGNAFWSFCSGWWCYDYWPGYPLSFPCDDCRTPTSVAAGDLDGDGNVDLVAGGEKAGNLSILFGQGNGQFSSPVLFDLTGAATPAAPAAALIDDEQGSAHVGLALVDEDEFLDILAIDEEAGEVLVLLNQGDGTFAVGPDGVLDLGLGAGIEDFEVGDVDGDTDADLIVVAEDGDVVVLLAQPDGSLLEPEGERLALGAGFAGMALVDVDEDGTPELLVADEIAQILHVVSTDGTGTYMATGTSYAVGSRPTAVAFGQLDGKPGLDLAILDGDEGTVHLYFGDGAGDFEASPQVIQLPATTGVAIVTLPRANGNPDDLAVAYEDEGRVGIVGYPNYGEGTFGPPGQPAYTSSLVGLGTASFNGDDRPDLFWASPDRLAIGVALGGPRNQ